MLDRTQRTETQDRVDLAHAFRLCERFAFNEGICNHLSVQLDGPDERFLINPYGVHWSEMTPEALLLIDGDGTILAGDGEVEDTAKFIHIAGHRANRRHKALFHTHMPWATALTMIEGGRLEMSHQTAVRFHGRTGYQDTFGGLAKNAEEGARISEGARDNSGIDVTFLANHGVVVGAPTVALAFDELYYLERACRQQVLAMSTGRPAKLIAPDQVEKTAADYRGQLLHFADVHFEALVRVMTDDPGHRFML